MKHVSVGAWWTFSETSEPPSHTCCRAGRDMQDDHAKERLMNHSQRHASQGEHPLRNAAIYARVSTEDQGKGFSIPTQIEAGQKLAEREGYTVPETHVLIDEGFSSTTMDR